MQEMAADSGGNSSDNETDVTAPFVQVDFNDLDFYERCGEGAFGSVYRAAWKPQNRIVAVKKLLVLEKEAQVLSLLSHKNIIKFFGAVIKPPNFCIITEYAENGSLYAFLAQQEHNSMLSFEQILRWSIEIAAGMNYLHYEAPVKVIHRDLKSKNVVISSDFVCKICDFGASRFIGGTTKMSVAGTLPWMAPEVIQCLPVSEACDIWSYGVVLWELFTHEVPFKGIEGFQVAWAVVEKEERLPIPKSCPPKFADLMRWCWKTDPKERPIFSLILKQLYILKEDDSLYDEASIYLTQKSVWRKEIEFTLELMKKAERDLNQKQKQLEEWENRLLEKENNLKHQKLCMELYKHDVNMWSEKDVYLWIKQFGSDVSAQDLEQYADLFLNQHISGKRLLMLSSETLKDMGINSVGHRIHLIDEIEKLRDHNKRMIDFPPLEKNICHNPTLPIFHRPKTLKLTLLFGNHVRLGMSSSDHKWKMFVEVDDDENPLNAITCIKEVSFECRQAGLSLTRITQPPFVMERWCLGITPDTIVTCIVTYQHVIKKPRFTKHCHQVKTEGKLSEQREVTLTRRQIREESNSPHRKSSQHSRSAPTASNVWKNCFFPDHFTSQNNNAAEQNTWANIAAGDNHKTTLKKKDFPSLRTSDTSSSEGESILDTVKALGLHLFDESSAEKLSEAKRFIKPDRKVLFSLHESSSSESLGNNETSKFFRERRSSTPSRKMGHQRRKYRHSSSDSGFSFEDHRDGNLFNDDHLNKHFVKFQECRIRLQREIDHVQSSSQRSNTSEKSHHRNTMDSFNIGLEDRFSQFPFRFHQHYGNGGTFGKRCRGRGRLFARERGEPELRAWSLDREEGM